MVALPVGSFYRWMRRAGRLGDQHKGPRATNDRTVAEELRAMTFRERPEPILIESS